jgi:hypothetical protein
LTTTPNTEPSESQKAQQVTTAIGIVFGQMEDLTLEVLTYLLIYQNSIQKTFEFRILAAPQNDPFIERLASGVTHQEAVADCHAYMRRVIDFNDARASAYGLRADPVAKIVLLTNTRFSDNFYLVGVGNWTILAFGGWQQQFAPPSIVEYYLTHVITASLDALSHYNRRHFDTRGCAFDFNASLYHTRYKSLSGQLCNECAERIEQERLKQTVDDANTLFRRVWLGTPTAPSDVALTVKKLGYDLFHTSGPTPTLWEKLKGIMAEEGAKNVIKSVVTGLVAGFVLLFGLITAKSIDPFLH